MLELSPLFPNGPFYKWYGRSLTIYTNEIRKGLENAGIKMGGRNIFIQPVSKIICFSIFYG